MTDIHSHILCGVDDGAVNMNESVRLCNIAFDNRVNTVIATPHLFKYHKLAEVTEKRDASAAELREILNSDNTPVNILTGYEVYCSEAFTGINDFTGFTLAGSRYILMEFDFDYADIYSALRYCDYASSHGLVPIIAHPERYGFLLDDYDLLNSFSSRNVLFQLNAGSLIGHYGSHERRLALTMLQCGYCDFLATDAHSHRTRSTNLLEMICAASDDLTEQDITTCTSVNPRKVITDSIIEKPVRGKIAYDLI